MTPDFNAMNSLAKVASGVRLSQGSAAMLREMTAILPGTVYLYQRGTDGSHGMIFVSEGVEAIYEVTPAQILADAGLMDSMVLAEDRPQCEESVRRSFQEMSVWDETFRIRTPSGRMKWIKARSRPTLQPDGAVVWSGLLLDVTEERERQERMKLLNLVAVHANDAVIITEAEPVSLPGPRILYVNEAFTRMTGYAPEEVIGKTPRILQGPNTDRATLDRIREALLSWRPITVELVNRRKDGTEFCVEFSLTPVADERGWFTHWVSVQREVTGRREAEEELRRAKSAAQAANRAKGDFLATMSHEIRTPLNGVLGFLQLLEQTTLDAQQREYVEIIRRSGDSLLALIGEILDFSRIESGSLELFPHPFPLEATIRHLLETFTPQARKKGLELRLRVEPGTPGWIVADSRLLEQVLLNLVSNAIKFTASGQVELSIGSRERKPSEADGPVLHEVEFRVADTGTGIPENQVEKIFDAFVQADSGIQRRYGGTGLGLSISRRLVEFMGGKIRVESQLGKGSVFIFSLLVLEAPEATPQEPEVEMKKRESSPARPLAEECPLEILVAEDNEINAYLTGKLLQGMGYQPRIVADGEEALAALRERRYQLLLTDLHMPRLDGLTLVRQIRQEEERHLNSLHIVALTASATFSARERCMEAGMNDYLGKPIDQETLRTALRSAFRKINSAPGASDAPSVPSEFPVCPETNDPVNLNTLRRAFGDVFESGSVEMETMVRQMCEVFLAETPPMVGAILAALDAGDAAALKKSVHKLKGSCGNLHARPLVRICLALEALEPGRPERAAELRRALEEEVRRVEQALRQALSDAKAMTG